MTCNHCIMGGENVQKWQHTFDPDCKLSTAAQPCMYKSVCMRMCVYTCANVSAFKYIGLRQFSLVGRSAFTAVVLSL